MLLKKVKKWLKEEKNLYIAVAIFFLLMQCFIFLGNYKAQRYDIFFWFCNHTPLFFAIAFFFNQKDIIKGLINVGFLGQFVWAIDFIGKLTFNTYIFSMTNYVFENPNGLWVLLPIGIHIFATNVALFYTYDKKPNVHVLLYSLIYIIFLYGATLAFTPDSLNVNCVIKACIGIEKEFTHYTYFWSAIVFFIVVLPTHGLQTLLYKFSQRKKETAQSSIKKTHSPSGK